jgi:hypothetical protein
LASCPKKRLDTAVDTSAGELELCAGQVAAVKGGGQAAVLKAFGGMIIEVVNRLFDVKEPWPGMRK